MNDIYDNTGYGMEIKSPVNTVAILSLILSAASVCCCGMWYISLIMAVFGIVFGILGIRNHNPRCEDAAIAGIIVGVVGLALAIFAALATAWLVRNGV